PRYVARTVTKHLIPGRWPAALGFVMALAAAPLAAQSEAAPPPPADAREGSEAIRPGDVVRLTVFRSDSLSGEYPVNQFGTVVLPVVGEYDVTRETHRTLRDRVIRDL